MGSTKFEGGLLQRYYNMNKLNYPKPKIRITYKRITIVTMFTQYTKNTKIQQDVSEINTLAKHAPIALTLLDCFHWQP
jgi:hypothetical protein